MAFPRKLLNYGEEIILDLKPHWLFIALQSGVLTAVIIVAIIVFGMTSSWTGVGDTISTWIVAFGFVAAAFWFGLTYLRWVTTMFVLTTDRIISRSGIVSKHGTDIPLERVNTVLFSQGVLERMVGAGDLTVESASETGASKFSNVRKPNVVQKEIYVAMENNENRRFDRMAGAATAANAAGAAAAADATAAKGDSIPDQIAQLSELHQRGVLSDAEFARKKAELLDRM